MKKSLLLVALFLMVIVMTSCSTPGEVSVSKYFQGMKHNDKDTMSSMAIEPKDLEYKTFEIVAESEPEITEFALPKLLEEKKNLEKERTDQGNNALDARDEVDDLKDELAATRRSSAKRKLEQEIADAEEAFKAEEEKYKSIVKNLGTVKKKIQREKDLIRMSTGMTENLEMFEGETGKIKVDTKITLPDDSVKDYIFLLIKYDLKLQDKVRRGRLIITHILTPEEYEAVLKGEETQEEPPAEQATEEVTEEAPAENKDEGTAEEAGEK